MEGPLQGEAKEAAIQRFIQRMNSAMQIHGGMPPFHERHIAIYQIMVSPECSEIQFSSFPVSREGIAENDFANTYFKRDFDPNFKRLCKEYEDDPEEYFRKFEAMNYVYFEPVPPLEISLATFAALFNEDWTRADHEYNIKFVPRFKNYIGKSKLDEVERWAKREMLSSWPGKRPENLLDGFESVEDAMNYFVYKTPYYGGEMQDWTDLMSGKSIRPDEDADMNKPFMKKDENSGELVMAEVTKDEMKARRNLRDFLREKKESNRVKAYVTKGRAEDYDIEKVLKDLEDVDSSKKSKKKKKKSKKKEPENMRETVDESQEVSLSDCTICFCPREQTWMVDPCGHATFCGDCIGRIFEGTKRCPMCQAKITSKKRIYQ